MSKNKYGQRWDDEDRDSSYHDTLKDKRRQKRMKNALRSRDVYDLLDMDDDDYSL